MRGDAYKISTSIAVVTLTIILNIMLIFISTGCGPQQNENRQSVFAWNVTEDGKIHYRWIDDGSVVIKYADYEYLIQRRQIKGQASFVRWEWEDDGDIDIEIGSLKYDLDSPFDFVSDNNDFGTAEFIAGAATGAFLKKSKKTTPKALVKENKALRNKLERQKAELKRQQTANAKKKVALATKAKKRKYAKEKRAASKRRK